METWILLIDGNQGIYIPQSFAQSGYQPDGGWDAEDRRTLQEGPESEFYWEAWDSVLRDTVMVDETTGDRFTLYQDGDLWAVPEGFDWDTVE